MPQKQSVLNLKHFKGNRDPEPDFYIRTFQQHKKDHPFVMEPHAHDFYLVMLFTKGSGKHTIDFREYSIKRGSVFFMVPSEIHSWQLSDDADGYVLFFNPAFYMMDVLSRNIKHLPFFNPENKMSMGLLKNTELGSIEKIILSMDAENKADAAFKKNIIRSYLDILLYKLADLLQAQKPVRSELTMIPALLSLIEDEYSKHHPLSFYSEKLKVSTQKLNALCKLQLNKTMHELVQGRLLTEAKRLLAYSSLTIGEIAYQLRFNDNSYFNRFFKRQEGITPEQFRNKRKSTINNS